MGGKHWEKENCLLRAVSPFPTVFSKGLFSRGIKRCHCVGMGYPFAKRQILYTSKFEEFADDNFKCDNNGRKFSEWAENTVGKGEIARYSVLRRLMLQTHKNQGLFGKGLRLIGWLY